MIDIYSELSRLNPRQKEAVTHIDGPLLILAGAGTGKTRVITMRTAYLIQRGIDARSVLALTFTNKAAREMQERVRTLHSAAASPPLISTFHSLCLRILRKEIEVLGYRKDFTIYDTSEQLSLLRTIMNDIRVHEKSIKAESILEQISRTKNSYAPAETSDDDDHVKEISAYVFPKYGDLLKSMNVLDFDDLLLLTLNLFREHPDVLEQYRDRFRYIMVDEYQDTNLIQYHFIRLLAGSRGNLCVVGDDDQSIYGWRGANIGNILEFEKDFPGTVTVRLEQNYRSCQNILQAANGVIDNNTVRMDKSLWTKSGEGQKVSIFRATDTEDEASWIADRIALLRDTKNIPYEDVALLYRANAFSRPFEEALRSQRIPYSVIGGTSYFDRREIRDLIAYLKVIANPADDLSLLRAVNAPRRGLGPSSMQALSAYCRSQSVTLLEAFGSADTNDGLSPRAAGAARSLHELITGYGEKFDRKGKLAASLEELISAIDFRDYLVRLYKTPEAAHRRIENLDGLIASLKHYEASDSTPSLAGFLETLALTDLVEDKDERDSGGVTLISFHSAKGLEFPVVFIVGAEEDIIPHKKSAGSTGTLEEERRLFYVGITRAMKKLYITHTDHRSRYGKEVPSVPSRFIAEIPDGAARTEARFEKMNEDEEKAYVKGLYASFMARFDD